MTTPKVSTISRGGSRFYVHPDTQEKVPGVTSVLGMLPKGFLKFWASKVVAEMAVDNLGEVVSIAMRDREAAIDFLKRSPDRFTKKAADVGTEAHDLFERMAKGENLGRVHPDLKPFVDHFESFLTEFSPEFVFMEETVWSETHNYAGSFDAFATIEGERVWLDYKTTRSGVHEEVAIQLAAYRYADYIVRSDGGRVPMPGADGGAVLHVRPEGWSLIPVRCDEDVFQTFLHLRQVFEWERELKGSVIGDAINAGATPKRKRPSPKPRA
jgi:hypothetical protein